MKKMNRVLRRFWVASLSIVMLTCAMPVVTPATTLDVEEAEIVSADSISKNSFLGNTVLKEVESADSISDNSAPPADNEFSVVEEVGEGDIFSCESATEYHTITLEGLGGIDESSFKALRDCGFEISGSGYATIATIKKTSEDSLVIPQISMKGWRFVWWDDLDPEVPDYPIVVLEAGDITQDLTYYADFREEFTLTLSGLNGITAESVETLKGYGFTVNNGTATMLFCNVDNSFMLPAVTKPGCEFLGWYWTGDDPSTATLWMDFYSSSGDQSFTASFSGESVEPEKYTLTLLGLEGTTKQSISGLESQGFTVNGDTAKLVFNNTMSKFYLPAVNKPGSSFLGWYETGKSPSTASPYVEFNPATSYDTSYTASFQEDVSVRLRSSLTLYEGQSFGLTATVNPEGSSQDVTWTNSDPNVVDLVSGTVKAKHEGTCKITATSVVDSSKKAVCKVTILKSEVTETDEYGNPINPGDYAMDENGEMNIWVAGLNKDGYHYTGNAIKPQIHVYNGGRLLREGTDYKLSYKNNTNVSASITSAKKKPQIVIKMKGQYSGSKTVYFEILSTPLSELTATDPTLDVAYKAKKKNQIVPTLEYQGAKIKYGKKDLSFKWFEADASGNATDTESACIDPGLYAVKVYAGTSGKFTADEGRQVATINVIGKTPMESVNVNGFKSKLPYNNGAEVKQPDTVSLSYKSGKTTRVLEQGVDYTVVYDNNYNIGTATVTYEAVKDSSGNYTGDFAGKIVKTYKITGKYNLDSSNTTVTLANDSYEFQNANIKPDVTVTVTATDNDGNPETRTLRNGKDYTVTYKNNKAVASETAVSSKGKDIAPQVVIKGKGNYATSNQGMVERFNITKTELSSLVLTISDKPYSNKAGGYKSPKILFTDRNYRDLKLKEGKDYTVTYATSDGSETPAPGQIVYVAINAKEGSPYTGNIAGEYRITGSMYTDIGKAKVAVNPNSKGKTTACAYTGSKIEPGQTDQPDLRLTIGSGKKLKVLKPGVDYEIVSYHNNINPGKEATVRPWPW